jgi:hypothetical protein
MLQNAGSNVAPQPLDPLTREPAAMVQEKELADARISKDNTGVATTNESEWSFNKLFKLDKLPRKELNGNWKWPFNKLFY